MYKHTHPFRLTKLAMAFAEYLVAARVSALSFLFFFFLFIFGHRFNVKKASENKKRGEETEKKAANKEEKEKKKR
jgi:hypothetical protein